MTSTDQWLPVPGYEGLYEVSDQGAVRSLDREVVCHTGQTQRRRGRVLSVHLDKRGRRTVVLWSQASQKTHTVYTLVLSAFVGPKPPGMEACHNNGDSADDRLVNLRWGTKPANVADTVRHGTHQHARKTHCGRGHQLVEPNLVPFRLRRGERDCRSCDRAKQSGKYARQHGLHLDVDRRADENYARLMARS